MRLGRDMAADPGLDMGLREGRGDDQEALRRQPRDREIGFDTAARVQELRVDDAADADADRCGRDAVQHRLGVAALYEELGEGALLEHADALAHRAMLLGMVGEPVLPSPAVLVLRSLAGLRIPIGPFPAGGFAEAGPSRGQPVVQDALLDVARTLPLPIRPVVL